MEQDTSDTVEIEWVWNKQVATIYTNLHLFVDVVAAF